MCVCVCACVCSCRVYVCARLGIKRASLGPRRSDPADMDLTLAEHVASPRHVCAHACMCVCVCAHVRGCGSVVYVCVGAPCVPARVQVGECVLTRGRSCVQPGHSGPRTFCFATRPATQSHCWRWRLNNSKQAKLVR